MYRMSEPNANPRFFNPELMRDFVRLADLLPEKSVLRVYAVRGELEIPVKIFDNESLQRIRRQPTDRAYTFILDHGCKMNSLRSSSDDCFPSAVDAERFAANVMSTPCDTALAALSQLVDMPYLMERYSDMLDLLSSPSDFTSRLDVSTLLVLNLGCSLRKAGAAKFARSPSMEWYKCTQLGQFSVGREAFSPKRIVCLTFDRKTSLWFAYTPKKQWAKAVLDSSGMSRSSKPDAGLQRGEVDYSGTVKRKTRRRPEKSEPPIKRRKKYRTPAICPCDICTECRNSEYASVIDPGGPQTKYISPLDAPMLLRVCGLATPDNVKRMEECLRISVSAFDTEAFTRSIDDMPIRVDPVTEFRAEGGAFAKQELCLAGHAYNPSEDESTYEYDMFNFCDGDPHDVMDAFVGSLLKLRLSNKEKKKKLLQPVREAMERVRKAHFEFFYSRGVSLKHAAETYDASLFGKLERSLDSMENRHCCVAINAKSYDFVIMQRLLVSVVRERRGLRIMLSGSKNSKVKHSKIRFASISLICVSELLPPACSLRKLTSMVGLEEEKAYFPYECLRSPEDLLRETLPPPSSELWYDTLNQRQRPESEITAAFQLFRERNCSNILQYLSIYMETDCVVLLKSTQRWFFELYRTLGIHPFATEKYSVASFSFASVIRKLSEDLRPSFFVTSVNPAYSIMRKSCIGGLSCVFAHEGPLTSEGQRAEDGAAAGLPGGRSRCLQPEAGILACDVHSLYGTSLG